MTKEEINSLCNFQSIYNKKEDRIYSVKFITKNKDERTILCLNINCSVASKALKLCDADLLSDNWSYSVPYEE